jgi:ATP-dependent 26S proteasome regulatory subunit
MDSTGGVEKISTTTYFQTIKSKSRCINDHFNDRLSRIHPPRAAQHQKTDPPHLPLLHPQSERAQVLTDYRKKVLQHREMETKVKSLRLDVRDLVKQYDKTEDDLSALQSVGNIIGEVLKSLGNDKFIVKSSSGPRYVVGVRSRLDQSLLKGPGWRWT